MSGVLITPLQKLSELCGVILTGIFPQCVDSRRDLDCAGELVSSRMYSFASLVALAIYFHVQHGQ